MRDRILSVTQARSQYLRKVAEAKQSTSTMERHRASQEVKMAVRALQRAQMTARLRQSRGRVVRPLDWNEEIS